MSALTTTDRSSSVAISKPKPLTEFTLFPDLPAEMRLRVWKLSLDRRVVSLALTLEALSQATSQNENS